MVEKQAGVTGSVWFLTELFHPGQTSTAYIMTRIAEHVAEVTPVTVLCGPEKYDDVPLAARTRLHPGVTVVRVASRGWDKGRLAARLTGAALLTAKMGAHLARRAVLGDTVVLVTNPATLLPVVAEICRRRRLRLVVIVHDVFPENLVAAHILDPNSAVFPLLRRVFNRAYSSAQRLLVIGRDMQELMRAKIGTGGSDRITVIENWAETEEIYPLAGARLGPIRLQFAGNLGRVQGLLPLLEAIRRAENPSLAVDFLGGGAMRHVMQVFVDQHSLANVRILPPFPRENQLEVLNDSDIGIVSLAEGMLGVGVPSKAYNILAAGKPILFIGDSRSEIARLISESGAGWVFTDYGESLVAMMRSLTAAMRPELALMGQRARQLAESRYSKARQLDAYRAAILS